MKRIAKKIHKLGVVVDLNQWKSLKAIAKAKQGVASALIREALDTFIQKNQRFLGKRVAQSRKKPAKKRGRK